MLTAILSRRRLINYRLLGVGLLTWSDFLILGNPNVPIASPAFDINVHGKIFYIITMSLNIICAGAYAYLRQIANVRSETGHVRSAHLVEAMVDGISLHRSNVELQVNQNHRNHRPIQSVLFNCRLPIADVAVLAAINCAWLLILIILNSMGKPAVFFFTNAVRVFRELQARSRAHERAGRSYPRSLCVTYRAPVCAGP